MEKINRQPSKLAPSPPSLRPSWLAVVQYVVSSCSRSLSRDPCVPHPTNGCSCWPSITSSLFPSTNERWAGNISQNFAKFHVCRAKCHLSIFIADTPKKVTCSNLSGCFLCTSTVSTKERVRIFGRSADVASVVGLALGVNLEAFDTYLNSTLYIYMSQMLQKRCQD